MEQFISAIEGFSGWSHAERIRFFGWYIHTAEGKPRFGTGDIRRCYDGLCMAQPANISQQLTQLVEKRDLLKDSSGFFLERRVRDEFEDKYGRRQSTIQVDKLLLDLPLKVPDVAEREFLDEALRCFRAEAFRAAIVMSWNLAFAHLCSFVLARHIAAFNKQLPISFPNKKLRVQVFSKTDDFAELKESEFIQVCRAAAIVSGDVARILEEKLGKRNSAAHPSAVRITRLQAEAYIDELVNNVVLKLV